MIYFSSDFHLGHNAILKYREKFATRDEHDAHILDRVSKLNKRDILYVLGDFIFDCAQYEYYIEQFKKMPCRIKLVMGNHDSLSLYKEDRFENQLPLFTYKKYWLSHAPIHPQELRNRIGNIHGHLHGHEIPADYYTGEKRYFNVCLDNNNYELVNFEDIKAKFEKKDYYYEFYTK